MTEYERQFPDYSKYLELQIGAAGCSGEAQRIPHHRRYTDYFLSKCSVDKSSSILDVGCNVGLSFEVLKENGFSNLSGIELNPENVKICHNRGFNVYEADAHKVDFIPPSSIDIVFATHSLEHMYSPSKVASSIYTMLKPQGYLFVVLPYPNSDSLGHLGGVELGTCQVWDSRHTPYDEGKTVMSFFKNLGFSILDKKYDEVREPEIWLLMQKEQK